MIKSRIVNCNKSGGNHLDLSELKLTKYPSELKKPLNKIQPLVIRQLNCSKNQLNDFKWDLLNDFHSLESLDLSGNPFSSLLMIGLPGSLWLKTLVTLNLSNCKLTRFGRSDLKQMPALRSLSLANNNIVEITDEQLTLPDLEHLDLSNNPITQLPLVGCAALMVLDISGCKLIALPAQISEMDRLVELRAKSNAIKTLPDSIGKLTRLQILELQENQLTDIPISLGYCRGLLQLRLENNPIEDYSLLGAITMGPEKLIAFLEKRLIERCQEVAFSLTTSAEMRRQSTSFVIDEASTNTNTKSTTSPLISPIAFAIPLSSAPPTSTPIITSETTTPQHVSPRNNILIPTSINVNNSIASPSTPTPTPTQSVPRNIIQIPASPRHSLTCNVVINNNSGNINSDSGSGLPQQIKFTNSNIENVPQRMVLSNSPPMQIQQQLRRPSILTTDLPPQPMSLSSPVTKVSPLSELDTLRDQIYTLIRYDLKSNIATIYDHVVKSANIDNLVIYAKVIRSSQEEIEQLSKLLFYRNFQFTLNANSKALYTSSPQTVEDKFKYLKKLLKSKIEEVLVYSRSIVDHLEQCNLNDVMNILATIQSLNNKLVPRSVN